MNSRLGLSGVVLALLLLPASALAATPDKQAVRHPNQRQLEVAGSFTDTDFCGTGQTIEVKSKALLKLRRGANARPSRGTSRTVFVNPANDAWVVMKSAGLLKLRRVVEDTGFAVVASLRGAPAVIRTGTDKTGTDKAFRSRDPGYVLYVLHFSDEGRFLSGEVAQKGLDTDANRAFKRLCRIAIHALDL